jgi:flavin reductase (DIM6/NTAB) family NADH-FMN oxidoreductase RutF
MTEMPGDTLRNVMRLWTTGVSIVTSANQGERHGMTVNSFVSISLQPPRVSVTLATQTRTYALVIKTNCFGVTILSHDQLAVSERFAGKGDELGDRFEGIETMQMATGAPFIIGGLAYVDCRVIHTYPMENSTLFVGEVVATWHSEHNNPLIYHNRDYHRLEK